MSEILLQKDAEIPDRLPGISTESFVSGLPTHK